METGTYGGEEDDDVLFDDMVEDYDDEEDAIDAVSWREEVWYGLKSYSFLCVVCVYCSDMKNLQIIEVIISCISSMCTNNDYIIIIIASYIYFLIIIMYLLFFEVLFVVVHQNLLFTSYNLNKINKNDRFSQSSPHTLRYPCLHPHRELPHPSCYQSSEGCVAV